MINQTKEFRRKYGLSHDKYQDFKDFYLEKYNRKTFNTLKELQDFIGTGVTKETLEMVESIEEWSQYRHEKFAELELIESYLSEEMNKHLASLNKYGYIYDIKNLTQGDSSFVDDENIEVKVFAQDISDCLEGNSILPVKKALSKDAIFDSLIDLINKEIFNLNIKSTLYSFEKSVKIVYDGLMLRVDEGKASAIIRIGIKAV